MLAHLRRVVKPSAGLIKACQRNMGIPKPSLKQDFADRMKQNIVYTGAEDSASFNQNRSEYANQLKDYEVPSSTGINTQLKEEFMTPEKLQERHPIEWLAIQNGRQEFVSTLNDNEILLTNVAQSASKEGGVLSSVQKVREYLKKNVHRDLIVKSANFNSALPLPEQDADKISSIKVTLASKRQAHMVVKALHRHWIDDSLLKAFTREDGKKEQFSNRTILIRGLPANMREKEVLKEFGEAYGSVVALELPLKRDGDARQMEKEEQEAKQREAQFKRAELAVQQSLAVDEDYQVYLAQKLGPEVAAQVLLGQQNETPESQLHQEKLNGLVRIILRLQAEGQHVVQSKIDLLSLKESAHSVPNSSENLSDFKEALSAKQDRLQKIIGYLQENPALMQTANNDVQGLLAQDDPLAKMQSLAEGEITHAIDEIVNILNARESMIEKRLHKMSHHIGDGERILIEQKNFGKELEDVQAVDQYSETKLNAEQVLSANEQIHKVNQGKNMSTDEKMMRLLKGALNPFQDLNFNEENLSLAQNQDLQYMRAYEIPDPTVPRSIGRIYRSGAEFLPEYKENIDNMIKDLKENADKPFDELYHKEKTLIQNVIDAEKELKRKIQALPSPLSQEQQEILKAQQGPYERSKMVQQERLLSEKLTEDGHSNYDFDVAESQAEGSLRSMFGDSPLDQERMKILEDELTSTNRGYCFLTFSHADEARAMLMERSGSLTYLKYDKLSFHLKSKIDHSDLDPEYFVKRARNNAKIVDELKKVRETRQELRDFEKNLDKELPSRKKLKAMRNLAKEVIEDQKFHTRQSAATQQRGSREDQRMNEKLRELQAKYPHVDVSQLFDTERAEDARKTLHKKAYASYKAFEFLKNDVDPSKSGYGKPSLSAAKKRLEENDPYNFPELNESLAQVLSDDVMAPQIRDGGDAINTPGRRLNGYSDKELAEAYFGKDYARLRPANIDGDDGIFSTQKSLKEQFPMDRFTLMPEIMKENAKFDELGLGFDYKEGLGRLKIKDKALQREMDETVRRNEENEQQWNDIPHPEFPSRRSYMKDLERTYERYQQVRTKRGLPNTVDRNEWGAIQAKLNEEYGITKEKRDDWFEKLQDGWKAREGKFVRNRPKEKKVEADEEKKDENQDAKFAPFYNENDDQKYDQPLDRQQQRINNEYVYNVRENADWQEPLNPKVLDQMREEHQLGETESYESLKSSIKLPEAGQQYGGDWFRKYEDNKRTGQKAQSQGHNAEHKRLKDFYGKDQEDSDMSEREDADIYDHYRRQQVIQPQSDMDDQIKDFMQQLNPDEVHPDMPRFQGFLNSMSKGAHPFEQISRDQEVDLDEDHAEQENLEKELYERELMGRLMNETLTPRQFELISGIHSVKNGQKLDKIKDIENEQFLDRRETIRLAQEQAESERRRNVLSGKWTEQESHDKLKQLLAERVRAQKTPKQAQREFIKVEAQIEVLKNTDTPERQLEKEYYFDEGLGQSLQDHTAELKKQLPQMKVEVRRDRDGFAIVKTTFAPEYKYDLSILEGDFKQYEKQREESLEAVMESLIPEGDKSLNEDKLDQVVRLMTGQDLTEKERYDAMNYDFDAWTKLRMKDLVKERMNGRYKDDAEGFVAAFKEITANAGYDYSQKVTQSPINEEQVQRQVLDEIWEDRDRMREEVFDQLDRRARKHLFMTKRKQTDYVEPKMSESKMYGMQVQEHENASNQMEAQISKMEDQQDFDRDAYNKLKDNLRMRKEAKERLLNQGLPEFKAYLRF